VRSGEWGATNYIATSSRCTSSGTALTKVSLLLGYGVARLDIGHLDLWIWLTLLSLKYQLPITQWHGVIRQKNGELTAARRKTRQAVYLWRNPEALLRKNCCRWKAVSVTYHECVSVALVIQHSKCMFHIILSSVPSLSLRYFLILDFHRGVNTDFWFYGFCTVCEVNFPTTFRDPQRLPKHRREMYLAHRAKSLKSKISTILFHIISWPARFAGGRGVIEH
jgi:hypothetical protein